MNPVFIGGCDRSGTTLLGAMLGGHSACLTVPESQFLIDVLDADRRGSGVAATPVEAAWKAMRVDWRFKLWEIDVARVPSPLPGDVPTLIEHLVRLYGERVGKPSPSRWVDHTGRNTKYALTLLETFPAASFIHIVRDGRGVAASVMDRDWGPNTIVSAARFWESRLVHGLAAEDFLGTERVLRVRYEDLVGEPEATMAAVSRFLGLAYEAGMRHTGGFVVPPYSRGQHALIGRPLDTTRVDAWKARLTPRQVELFEWATGDLLRLLGYPFCYASPRGPTALETTQYRIEEAFHGALDRVRWRRRIRRHKPGG